MKNNKGFTLIEVLAVVFITAIILTIVGTSISTTIHNSSIKKYEAYEENLKVNMELYNIDHKEEIWNSNSVVHVSLDNLKSVNSSFKEEKKCDIEFMLINREHVSLDNYKYSYTVCIKCGNDKSTYVSESCH